MKLKRIELNEDEIMYLIKLMCNDQEEKKNKQIENEFLRNAYLRAASNIDDLIKKIMFAEEREQWAIRTDLRLGDLLKMVSTGQMIRVVFLNTDGDEDGNILEFENDSKDSKYPTTLLYEWVEWISSTADDYLRVEIITGKGRS